jgi:hypothetical protein
MGGGMLLTKHIDDGAAGLGVQIERAIGSATVPVRHHAYGGTDLTTKDHVVVLPHHRHLFNGRFIVLQLIVAN